MHCGVSRSMNTFVPDLRTSYLGTYGCTKLEYEGSVKKIKRHLAGTKVPHTVHIVVK